MAHGLVDEVGESPLQAPHRFASGLAQEARQETGELLELADAVASNIESDASAILGRVFAKSRRLRSSSRATAEVEVDSPVELPADDPMITPGEAFDASLATAEAEPESPLSRANNISELRLMAALLSRLADDLEAIPTE